ncbi:MAG: hypothetical protein GX210_01520 [Firmicutes bacterium]|nr:hypothetical protein [Bacillota bacterium]
MAVEQLNVYGVALVPVIVGLSELLKRAGLPSRFIPLVSLVLGIFFAVYYLSPGDIKRGLLLGVVLGLSSIGLFSGTKNTFARSKKLKF